MSKIISLDAKTISDSHRESTVEVNLKIDSGISVSASVPQGRSRGSFEAPYLKAGEAVAKIKNEISPALKNKEFNSQKELDGFLIGLDGSFFKANLGANAILAVSLAYARAASRQKGIPLWQYIRELTDDKTYRTYRSYKMPRLLVNIIGGGLHAKNNLNFQEYLIIPKTRDAGEALEISKKIYKTTGDILRDKFGEVSLGDEEEFAPVLNSNEEPFAVIKEAARQAGIDGQIDFGLDAAASNVKKKSEELFEAYRLFKNKYGLFYLEDPFAEEDYADFAKILAEFGENTLVAGDDLTTTNVTRMEIARQQKSINSVIIKPNQIGSLTETIEAIKRAKEWGWAIIVSHRASETRDDFIADLAFGVGADGLKAGAPAAAERLAKYERLAEIEKTHSF